MSFDAYLTAQLQPILDRISHVEGAVGESGARQSEMAKQVLSALGGIRTKLEQVDGLEAARAALDAKLSRVASELEAMRASAHAQGAINRKFGETIDGYGIALRDLENALNAPLAPQPAPQTAAPVAPVALPPATDDLSDLLLQLSAIATPAPKASGPRACSSCGVVPRELSRGMCPACASKGVH
jgi:hypothetical protein